MPHLALGEFSIQDELLLDPFWQSAHSLHPTGGFCVQNGRIEAVEVPSPAELTTGNYSQIMNDMWFSLKRSSKTRQNYN